MILETKRLSLRELRIDDLKELMKTLANPAAMGFYPYILNEAGTFQWIMVNLRRYEQFGIGLWAAINKQTNQLIGQIGLIPPEITGPREIEIAYLLAPTYWGKGYATEGAQGCMDYAFYKLGRKKVLCTIRPENKPSIKVAERLGMKAEGQLYKLGLKHIIFCKKRPK